MASEDESPIRPQVQLNANDDQTRMVTYLICAKTSSSVNLSLPVASRFPFTAKINHISSFQRIRKPTKYSQHVLALVIDAEALREPSLPLFIHGPGVLFELPFDIFDDDLALGAYERYSLDG